jgi:hypothetical protein
MMYVAEYGEVFPPAALWSDKLMPYVPNTSTFVCPSAPPGRCSYAFSAELGELRADSIGDAWVTIMLFESDHGWNAAGGAELLPERPRHSIGDHYAFADGRVSWVKRRSVWKGKERYWTKELQSADERRWGN